MKRKPFVIAAIAAVVAASVFIYCRNNLIEIADFSHESPDLLQSFDGFRVVHISDLHSKSFGK